ncbi:MAG: phasin family protein [Acidobacteriota bacterium]
MPRTAKSSKTTKATKRTKRVNARTAKTEHVASNQTPIELVKDMATKSLHFGLGLGAYILEGDEHLKLNRLNPLSGNIRENFNSLVNTAIHKGEQIEQQQRDWLTNFERTQRKRVRDFFTARRRDLQRTEASLEEKIEEVIAGLDIPTRSDIQQLNRRLNELSKQLAAQTTPRSTARRNKTVETPAAEPQSA